jgi:hypothetical protein
MLLNDECLRTNYKFQIDYPSHHSLRSCQGPGFHWLPSAFQKCGFAHGATTCFSIMISGPSDHRFAVFGQRGIQIYLAALSNDADHFQCFHTRRPNKD